jgi:hypothetical protein
VSQTSRGGKPGPAQQETTYGNQATQSILTMYMNSPAALEHTTKASKRPLEAVAASTLNFVALIDMPETMRESCIPLPRYLLKVR